MDGAKMEPSLPSQADAHYLKSSEGPCQGKDCAYFQQGGGAFQVGEPGGWGKGWWPSAALQATPNKHALPV